jgi:hypothetical protein
LILKACSCKNLIIMLFLSIFICFLLIFLIYKALIKSVNIIKIIKKASITS